MSTTDNSLPWPRVGDRVRCEFLGQTLTGRITDRELEANVTRTQYVYTVDTGTATVRVPTTDIHVVL